MRAIFILSVLIAQFAFAGDGSTSVKDGGHGILCRKPNLSFHPAGSAFEYNLDLLDFFEGPSLFARFNDQASEITDETIGSKYFASNVCNELLSRKRQVEKYLKRSRISNAFSEACRLASTAKFQRHLAETEDFGPALKRPQMHCKLVQIAVRSLNKGVEQVLIDDSLASMLTFSESAALLLHEALHKYFSPEENTQAVRQTVVYIFAEGGYQKQNRELISRVIQTGLPASPTEFRGAAPF
jgi:hypothetical protein